MSSEHIPPAPPSPSEGPPPSEKDRARGPRFWQTVGVVLGADLVITLLYTLISSGFSDRVWSDALCVSAIILSVASVLPFLLDAGRGVTMIGKMRGSDEQRRAIWEEERRKREKGMTITFALFLAALLIGLASVAAGLF